MKKTSKTFLVQTIIGFMALSAVLVCNTAFAETRYVSSGDCNDSTGSPAYCNIQKAVDVVGGDGPTIIEIAAGTYKEKIIISKNMIINGAGRDSVFVDGESTGTPLTIAPGSVVTVNNVSFINGNFSGVNNHGSLQFNNVAVTNNAGDSGGGINNAGELSLEDCLVSGNEARGFGGGISSTGSLTIENSQITDNQSSQFGGGISQNGSSSRTQISRTLIRGNHSDHSGGAILLQEGSPKLDIDNSTIAGNSSDYYVGGLYLCAGTVQLEFVTIANNTATTYSDVASVGLTNQYSFANVSARALILANNTLESGEKRNCTGAITSLGYNVIDDASNCTITATGTDHFGEDPLLGALTSDAITWYYPLGYHSPAADLIPSTESFCSGTDQSGVIRPQNGACDAGAKEAVDTDADGYFGSEDCDDTNTAVNPGATEVCGDGIDQDCSGSDISCPTASPVCGNSVVETGETCDDGNVVSADGCSATCQTETAWYYDNDADNYGDMTSLRWQETGSPGPDWVIDATDCDDTREDIHPGATELCGDSLDNDCLGGDEACPSAEPVCGNSVVETGEECDDGNVVSADGCSSTCQTETAWYYDNDADNYGDMTSLRWQETGSPGPDWVIDATDCDDTREDIHPGAAEVCNAIDDNCNGSVDENVTQTFYADVDADSYGDSVVSVMACTIPVGYVTNNTDCNDAEALAYTGATEIPGDGVDNDCDGIEAITPPVETPTVPPTTEIPVVPTDSTTPSDTDGDGIADAQDAFPNDATESVDSDGDGIGNNADTDDDGDGILDSAEEAGSTSGAEESGSGGGGCSLSAQATGQSVTGMWGLILVLVGLRLRKTNVSLF